MAQRGHISEALLAGLHDPAVRREAFDEVVDCWMRPLYWHVRRLVVLREDAEDVLQESFVRAYEALDDFRGGAAELRVWFTGSPPGRPSRICDAGAAASSPRSTT